MKIPAAAVALLFVNLSLTIGISAQYENAYYLPLTKREMSHQFPVRYIGTLRRRRPGYFEKMEDRDLPKTIDAGVSKIAYSVNSAGELKLTGRDRENNSWNADLGCSPTAYAARFYVADLDKNGIKDILLVFPTGGNGLAPTSHILSMMFDDQGRPVPFEADGYFQLTDSKVFDIVDLDGDRHAQLIYMNWDDGYWITTLYEARNARWEIRKKNAGRNYPISTRFTYQPNRKAVVPRHGRHPFPPALSDERPLIRGHLVSYDWADVDCSEDIRLNIKSTRGEVISCKPVSWYSTFSIVVDKPHERQIFFLSAEENSIRAALDQIKSESYAVSVFGKRRAQACSPELLWSQPLRK